MRKREGKKNKNNVELKRKKHGNDLETGEGLK